MSNNSTQATDEQLSSDNQGGTQKTCVILRGTLSYRVSAVVYLEGPSDVTEEDIMNLDESVWGHLAPSDSWLPDFAVDSVWKDEVDFELSDASDVTNIDARVGRTLDGQVVVLAN